MGTGFVSYDCSFKHSSNLNGGRKFQSCIYFDKISYGPPKFKRFGCVCKTPFHNSSQLMFDGYIFKILNGTVLYCTVPGAEI